MAMDQILGWYKAQTPANRKKLLLLAIAAIVVLGFFLSEQNHSQQLGAAELTVQAETIPFTGEIYVHVVGEVLNPGLYKLSFGARVSDAVAAAGGFAPAAFQQSVNLARVVADGEQVIVLSGSDIATDAANGLISLNQASLEQLETLPGVGPALAGRILEHRKQIGSFQSIEQLQDVSGIGPKMFAKLSPLLTL